MGLFSSRKKNNKSSDAKSTDTVMKPADFRKQYPFLAKLKIPEVVPAKVLDTLKSYVQGDDKERGAVREAADKSGYLVAMMSEEQMVNAGLAEKSSPSAGQLAQAIKKRGILSATLRNDLNKGYIAIIPNAKSLSYLANIPECTELKYQLALFPAAITDESELSCEPLKFVGDTNNAEGLVSFGDLSGFSDKGTELVINREDHTVSTEEYVETLNQDDEKTDPAGELSNSGKLDAYDPTLEPDPDEDVDVIDEDEDLPFGEEPESATSDEDVPADDDVDIDEDEDFDDLLSDEDGSMDISDEDAELLDKADALAKDSSVEEEPEEYDSKDAKDYATSLKELANKEIEISSDLGLNASTDDITSIYSIDNVPHLDLVDAGDDALQNRLNALRSTFNANIAHVLIEKRQHLISEYTAKLTDLAKEVENSVSVEENETYKAEFEKLQEDYKDAEAKVSKDIKDRQGRLIQEYDKSREEYIDAASKQAAVEYDANNKGILNQKVKAVEDDLSGKPSIAYNQGILSLNERRRSQAQSEFNTKKLDILGELREEFAKDDEDIHAMYDKFNNEVEVKLNESYAQEVKRAENLKDVAEHDTTVTKLTKELEELKEQNKQDVKSVEDEVTANFEKLIHNRDEEITHLKETIDNIKENHNSEISRINSDYESRLTNTQKLVEDLREQYHEKIEQNKLDYDRYSTTNRNKTIVAIVVAAVFVFAAFATGALWGGSSSKSNNTSNGSTAPTYVIPGVTQQSSNQSQSSNNNNSSSSNNNSDNNNSSSSSNHDNAKSDNTKSSDNVDKH